MLLPLAVIVVGILLILLISGIRYIPNNRIGIVEKRLSGKGSVKSGFIALNGEAGYQPDVLRGGLHYLMPIQYGVHIAPLVTITQGKIGYVFARDGEPLEPDADAGRQRRGQRLSGCGGLPAATAASAARSARSCAKAPTPSTWCSSWSSPRSGSTACRSAATRRRSSSAWREVIAERDGFRPVVIKDTDDLVGIVTVHDGPVAAAGRDHRPDRGR